MQKIFFKSKDGLKLCGIWHVPNKPTTKAVILAHGLTVDKDEDGIFPELAELLNDDKVSYEDTKEYIKNLKKGKLITIKDGEHGFQDRKEDRIKATQETLKFFLKYLS